jgi:predicted NBD/HSP70 family sugar kinase
MDDHLQRGRVLRPRQVRGVNSAAVLELLRRHERMSRAEIARHCGLSEGTVSRIVSKLIERSWVVEDGAENSTGGRPAVRLQLSQDRLAVGVDIQNWQMRFSVATMRGRLIETSSVRTPGDPDRTLDLIIERFTAYQARYGREAFEGLGVSARGIVDRKTGVVEMGNHPSWVKIPVRAYLQQELGLPVYVENNVRAAALAEYNYTHPDANSSRCLLFVMVDEGVGVGIILDGKLYAGPRMSAGEFGQMVIADDGGSERHDRPGCLERLVSNPALCDRYAALTAGRAGVGTGDSGARVRRICHRALEGEPEARQVLAETVRYLGIGIANLIWGFDPDTVVLSSTMNAAWPLMLPVLQDQFPKAGDWPAFRSVALRPSALGEDGALIGAASLPFAPLFQTGERGRVGGPQRTSAQAR